jgi:hypothetical protein
MQKQKEIGIVVNVGSPLKEEVWRLCKKNHSYCPAHGRCPDILDFEFGNGFEKSKIMGIENIFYCKRCKMVKMINVWNNCSGLVEVLKEVELPPLSSPSLKTGVSRGAD